MKLPWTDRSRFGIRARLLTLLLPAILGLLALDSFNDYRALQKLAQDAYDQVMLESVTALQRGVVIGPDGSLKLTSPSFGQSIFDAASPLHKHLHVGLSRQVPQAGSHDAKQPPQQTMNLLGEADLPQPPARLQTLAKQAAHVLYDSEYRGYPIRVVALQSQVVDGHGQRFNILIQAAESTESRAVAQAATLRQQLWRDARMLLVVIVLVWLGVTWSLQPLEQLRKTVLQSQGLALKPLDISGVPHEVAPLVEAINQHVASYSDLLDQQSQFLSDASHQLRTPLAIMLTQAGFALREKDSAQLHETLHAMVAQLVRSRRLCEQLLALADASEHTRAANTPTVVDLGTIAREVVLQYLTLAHEKNQDLGWVDTTLGVATAAGSDTGPAGTPTATPLLGVNAVGTELHEALANLVHNAIAYTPPGGQITVMVSIQDRQALAEVLDSGPGIAANRRDDVFKRFHRTASGTEKSRHGAGLGMAIARAYARRNGGDITLTDAPPSGDSRASNLAPRTLGLRATLSLPLALN